MNYNFKILNNTYKTINYINKILVNYPKKGNGFKTEY